MIKNILGTELEMCSVDPKTGFFRDGSCRTDQMDHGTHVVCAQVTKEFLDYTRGQGNDLSTPRPEFQFPGLKPGDHWCLCVLRWEEARRAGKAPLVNLAATHEKALEFVPLEVFQQFSGKSE